MRHSKDNIERVSETIREEGVQFINLQCTDILGVVKSVGIPVEVFPDVLDLSLIHICLGLGGGLNAGYRGGHSKAGSGLVPGGHRRYADRVAIRHRKQSGVTRNTGAM